MREEPKEEPKEEPREDARENEVPWEDAAPSPDRWAASEVCAS